MNKKILGITLIALFLGAAAFGAVKIVSAQQATDTPQATEEVLQQPVLTRNRINAGYVPGSDGACNGDCTMTQDQIRLRLQDGSGENCPNPEGCTGEGPIGTGAGMQYGQADQLAGNEAGKGAGTYTNGNCDMDQDRLRDGCCGDGSTAPRDGTGSQFSHGRN
ncbi:MAG TPA: hypothetical protein PKX67_01825 [Anaerolineaceae bacterium]|nr:hypothetical protein [Anaerolineaceae bacterium]